MTPHEHRRPRTRAAWPAADRLRQVGHRPAAARGHAGAVPASGTAATGLTRPRPPPASRSPAARRSTRSRRPARSSSASRPTSRTSGYKDADRQACGFDIEIAKLIAAKLGIDPAKIEYKEIPSANRETAIKGGEIDYYVGTYSITDKRKKRRRLRRPVLHRRPGPAGPQGRRRRSPARTPQGQEGLLGDRLDADPAGRDEELPRPRTSSSSRPTPSACRQLLDKQVDAVTTDDAILKGYAAQNPAKLKVVGKPFSDGEVRHRPAARTTRRCATSSTTLLETAGHRRHLAEDLRRHAGQVRLGGHAAAARAVLIDIATGRSASCTGRSRPRGRVRPHADRQLDLFVDALLGRRSSCS